MLRIKKNVNLTQLEKFGFKKGISFSFSDNHRIRIFVDYNDAENNGTIHLDNWVDNDDYYGTLDSLYNLIRAGFVDKL